MRIPRFHADAALAQGETVSLAQAAARHARAVLRLRPGADVVVFDGRGASYAATLVRVGRDGVDALLGAPTGDDCEPALHVTLAIGVSKGERMDLGVQKSVELGASRIVPVVTARSVVRLDAERAGRRREHWRAVAVAACEQCGRNRVPEVEAPVDLDRWLAAPPADGPRLLADPAARHGLAGLERPPAGAAVTLLIGPEGGLEERERVRASAHGFEGVRLGPRTLRAETAVIAGLAAVMTLWGDLG